jgi:hypothetical protein
MPTHTDGSARPAACAEMRGICGRGWEAGMSFGAVEAKHYVRLRSIPGRWPHLHRSPKADDLRFASYACFFTPSTLTY